MIIAFVLFGLAVLIYLVAARPQDGRGHQQDIAALIAHFDAQNFTSDEEQSEAEHRLYHEIRQLERAQQHRQRLPLWLLIAAPVLLGGITLLWYARLGGNFAVHWQSLEDKLNNAVSRSLYLGDLPQSLAGNAMHAYCQLLQTRTDREDPEQLDTLGQCFSHYGNHAAAAEVYRRLLRIAPQNDAAALAYAQAILFAHPDQAMPADVEKILNRLYRQNPDDILSGMLLATAYTRAGERDRALPIWQQLERHTPENHEFRELIVRSAAQLSGTALPEKSAPEDSRISQRPVSITIPPALLARLPESAQLFVMLSSKDNPIPLAVQKLAPHEQQTVTFSASDSMTGTAFLHRDDLVLRAILTADSDVSSERFGEVKQDFHLDTHPTLVFDAP